MTRYDEPPPSRPTRREAAEMAGYEPSPDDNWPTAPLADDDPWKVALEASVREAKEKKDEH